MEGRIEKLTKKMKEEINSAKMPQEFSIQTLETKKGQKMQLARRKRQLEVPGAIDGPIDWNIAPWNEFSHRRQQMENGNFTTLAALKRHKRGRLRMAIKTDEDNRQRFAENFLKAKNLIAKITQEIWFYHNQAMAGTKSDMVKATMITSLKQLLDETAKAAKALSPNQRKAKQLEVKAENLLTNLNKTKSSHKTVTDGKRRNHLLLVSSSPTKIRKLQQKMIL